SRSRVSHLKLCGPRQQIVFAQGECKRTEYRSERHTKIGGGGKPAQRTRAVFRVGGVCYIRLYDPDRAATGALHKTRQKQQEERVGKPENQIRDCRSAQRD